MGGRIIMVNNGSDYGKILCIVDIVDHNRVLVDAPGETRCQISLKRVTITDLKIDVPRSPKKSVLVNAFNNMNVISKFANSSWGKKIAQRKDKLSASDFDRFKSHVTRIKVA